jgi:ubiquitin carboxyl-terminal hydrolase 34
LAQEFQLSSRVLEKHSKSYGGTEQAKVCTEYLCIRILADHRRAFFGAWLEKVPQSRRHVSRFFTQFARLASRVMALDAALLVNCQFSDERPELLSTTFLIILSQVMSESANIGISLTKFYRWDWERQLAMMTEWFCSLPTRITPILDLLNAQIPFIMEAPKYIETLLPTCDLMARIACDVSTAVVGKSARAPDMPTAQEVMNTAFKGFTILSECLDIIIKQNVTCLSPDTAIAFLSSLSDILRACLSLGDPLLKQLLESRQRPIPDMPTVSIPALLVGEWRFNLLEKLIMSGQMQLRVIGVSRMGSDLLDLYNKFLKESESLNHPLMEYFAAWILDHQVVDYIVGTGSHPELILQSDQLMGFIAATNKFTIELTDTIWQTVTTSQDPRVVEATLRMVGGFCHLLDQSIAFYICERLRALPLESFSTPMLGFFDHLINCTVNKRNRQSLLGAPPYDLCVRLIQDSSVAIPGVCIANFDVQSLATKKFQDLLRCGPEPDVRKRIYGTCIRDLADRSSTAPGSICALSVLLELHVESDLVNLIEEYDLTRLLLEEFSAAVQAEPDAAKSMRANGSSFQARRELLFRIIKCAPATITPQLGSELWGILVGTKSRGHDDRQAAWHTMSEIATQSAFTNSFISACLDDYIQLMPAQYFTAGCLDFIRAIVHHELAKAPHNDEIEIDEMRGMKEMWRMVLSCSNDAIESAAINALVEIYIQGPITCTMSASKTQQTHLGLVNRCLDRLIASATALRGTHSADGGHGFDDTDNAASHVSPDAESLTLHRSLALLSHFLHSYHAKFGRVLPKITPKTGSSSNDAEGDLLDVKYQCFDERMSSGIRPLSAIGNLNTAAYLFAKLSEGSGFDDYRVYHRGQEVTLKESDLDTTLEKLHLGSHLLLVQRRNGAESLGGLVALEQAVMQRIDILWDLLALDDGVARKVHHCFFLTLWVQF